MIVFRRGTWFGLMSGKILYYSRSLSSLSSFSFFFVLGLLILFLGSAWEGSWIWLYLHGPIFDVH
jgi:FtsH-binding integral membrane protein